MLTKGTYIVQTLHPTQPIHNNDNHDQSYKISPHLYLVCTTILRQACVSGGGDDTQLRTATNSLTKAIADYKNASATVKGLESRAKAAAKPKAKAKAKNRAEPAV